MDRGGSTDKHQHRYLHTAKLGVENYGELLNHRTCALKYYLTKSKSPNPLLHFGWWPSASFNNALKRSPHSSWNFTVQTLLFRSPPLKSTLSLYWAGSVHTHKQEWIPSSQGSLKKYWKHFLCPCVNLLKVYCRWNYFFKNKTMMFSTILVLMKALKCDLCKTVNYSCYLISSTSSGTLLGVLESAKNLNERWETIRNLRCPFWLCALPGLRRRLVLDAGFRASTLILENWHMECFSDPCSHYLAAVVELHRTKPVCLTGFTMVPDQYWFF